MKYAPCGRSFRNKGSSCERNSLPDDCNAEPWNRRFLWRDCLVQTGGVIDCRRAKGIELMGGPKFGRQLLDKLRRRVNPVDFFKSCGEVNLFECLEPFLALAGRKRLQVGQFSFHRFALGGKFEVVFNRFPQQARHKTKRQELQGTYILVDEFPRPPADSLQTIPA